MNPFGNVNFFKLFEINDKDVQKLKFHYLLLNLSILLCTSINAKYITIISATIY